MKEVAEQNGFRFSHVCACDIKGDIYTKGAYEIKILHSGRYFVLTAGDKQITGKPNELQFTINKWMNGQN